MCPPVRAHWRHLMNMIEFVPTRVHYPNRSVQPFLHRSRQNVVRDAQACPFPYIIHASLSPPESITQTASQSGQSFMHSSWQTVTMGPSPKNSPFPWGTWTPISHVVSWAYQSPQPKQHLNRFSCSCTDDRKMSLYFKTGTHFPQKIVPSHGGAGPHLIHGSLGQCRSSTQRHLDLFSLAGLTTVTDKSTDRPCYSVGNNRQHLCIVHSTAMWPNNTKDRAKTCTELEKWELQIKDQTSETK